VFVDRLWQDQEFVAGLPGIYVPVMADDANAWSGAEIYRDIGAGYQLLGSVTAQNAVGVAATALASTTIGTETVDIDLAHPTDSLPSYTAGEVTAGKGWVILGSEIFQYQTATQQSTTPNRWRLSVLSNRAAKCTVTTGHAIGDKFAVLEGAKFFQLELSEIGQTRNYKAVTLGQSIGDVSPISFTFNAPNFTPTTPADYNVSYDNGRNELVHTWTPISSPCLIADYITYEIYADSGGSPGSLLWSGTANQWREAAGAVGGTRNYHFRAKTNLRNGSYVTDSVTYAVSAGAPGVAGRWEPTTIDNGGTCEVLFDDDCDVVMTFVAA
jgi:hypothetical protein